jgi:hypothetical protein
MLRLFQHFDGKQRMMKGQIYLSIIITIAGQSFAVPRAASTRNDGFSMPYWTGREGFMPATLDSNAALYMNNSKWWHSYGKRQDTVDDWRSYAGQPYEKRMKFKYDKDDTELQV